MGWEERDSEFRRSARALSWSPRGGRLPSHCVAMATIGHAIGISFSFSSLGCFRGRHERRNDLPRRVTYHCMFIMHE